MKNSKKPAAKFIPCRDKAGRFTKCPAKNEGLNSNFSFKIMNSDYGAWRAIETIALVALLAFCVWLSRQ